MIYHSTHYIYRIYTVYIPDISLHGYIHNVKSIVSLYKEPVLTLEFQLYTHHIEH